MLIVGCCSSPNSNREFPIQFKTQQQTKHIHQQQTEQKHIHQQHRNQKSVRTRTI